MTKREKEKGKETAAPNADICADICIIGGGIAGLACAVFVRRLSPNASVVVLERGDINAGIDDGKSVVFNARSAKYLIDAECWDDNARPLHRVRAAFDGSNGVFDIGGKMALGYGASHLQVRKNLAAKLQKELISPAQVQHYDDANGKTTFAIGDKTNVVHSRMTVFACASPLLPPGFRARDYDYHQAAIALTATAKNPPDGNAEYCALEQFTGRGMVALVPRSDDKVGIVICAPTASAGEVNALSDAALSKWLNKVFGGRLGLSICGKRAVYAPKLRHVYPLASGRTLCIGAGATQVHPAGAQGLNLAIQDAKVFAECWRDNIDGDDNRYDAICQTYRRRRRKAHMATIAATSTIAMAAKICTAPPLAKLGGAAASILSAFVNLPPIKTSVISQISGSR
ncbi:MAG: FAD-dependent oxidoreductase [Gammaproteobacteria bacterium]